MKKWQTSTPKYFIKSLGRYRTLKLNRKREDIADWVYRLVKVEGKFEDKAVQVQRAGQGGRMGSYVIRSFLANEGFRILVNCGWIPEVLESVPEFDSKANEVIGIVKLDENKEIKRTEYLYPDTDEFHNLIDIEKIFKEFGVSENYEKNGFIDRIIKDSDDHDTDLYPVTQTTKTFARPYLTPRKHMEYATFWGCSAAFGLFSIIHVLLKK